MIYNFLATVRTSATYKNAAGTAFSLMGKGYDITFMWGTSKAPLLDLPVLRNKRVKVSLEILD